MERAFVDTSAWFAYANREDPVHRRIRNVLQTFQGRLITSNFIDNTNTPTRCDPMMVQPSGDWSVFKQIFADQAALATVEGVIKGAVKIIARLTYRQRYEQSTGRDPLRCPHCRGGMGVWRIWHPTYGVIYDEVQVIKRGTYASSAPRSGP